ncbi:major facilitator superfamily domain-containing protein 6-B-like [Stylophora pistillata]|uniref:major facilitator superfamily domain-containing protein 6-B-like n=1 Tax=Stylophora pistillata TaxID=50429 RepID=UPI000C04FF91|nr:major facilitator superfamily domain-containing protein 6-B-like [Stylophora pistillata]
MAIIGRLCHWIRKSNFQNSQKFTYNSRQGNYLQLVRVNHFQLDRGSSQRDLKDVCNVTIHNHDKEEEGLRINNDLKDQTEVASSEHSAQKPPQDFTSALATGVEYVECDSKEFLFLLLVTIIGTAIAAPAQAFADTVTLQSLNGETHKYGRVRLWGSLGWGIGGFSVGAAVSANYHTNQCGETVIDYMPCFYVYAAAMSVAFVCATQFQFDQPFVKEEQEVNVVDGSKTQKILQGLKVFRNPQFCFVMFIAFFCGSATGFIETFLFWYLHELGGGQLLFSVINGLNCAAEVCVFFVTDKLLSFLGHINVIYVALFCYSLRFTYFFFMKSPWAVLPAELLQGITTAAFWSSCVSYVGLHPGASNTVQGILSGVYMGLGFASGGFMGGFLVQFAEMKTLFLLYALASFCVLIIFVVLNKVESKP